MLFPHMNDERLFRKCSDPDAFEILYSAIVIRNAIGVRSTRI